MKKILLSLISVCGVAMLGGCVSLDEYHRTKEHLNTEQQAGAALSAENQRLSDEAARLRAANKKYEDQIKNMTVAGSSVDADMDRMKEELRRIWGSEGRSGEWDWVETNGALGVRLDDRGVLFRSGSWDLTDGAKGTLGKLVDMIKPKLASNNGIVRVDGHTDIDPIKALGAKGVKDNTHLSALRANAVRQHLIERGIPKDRIFVAGFGEYWPVQPGSDAKSKQANRRVEIFMGSAEGLSIGTPTGQPLVSRK